MEWHKEYNITERDDSTHTIYMRIRKDVYYEKITRGKTQKKIH